MRRWKKLLSYLLCFAMVFSFLPTTSYAALADGVTEKAKIELHLLKETDTGFVEMSASEVEALDTTDDNNKFFVGAKMVDFRNIKEAAVLDGDDSGLAAISFALDYRSDYLKIEPTLANEAGEVDAYDWGDVVEERLIKNDPESYVTKIISSSRKYDMGSSNLNDDTLRNEAGQEWGTAYFVANYANGVLPVYKCDKDEYLFLMQFEILQKPADGDIAFLFSENNTKYTLTFGKNANVGNYQAFPGGPTEAENDIYTVVDFDTTETDALFPKQCTVNYDAGEGKDDATLAGMPDPITQGITQGRTYTDAGLTLPKYPTRDGKVCTGWYTAATGGTKFDVNTKVNDDMTLYAQWDDGYMISFDANGGKFGESTDPVEFVKANSDPDLATGDVPTNMVRDGYDFAGWNTASNGTGTAYADAAAVVAKAADKTTLSLYAQWEPTDSASALTVKFNGNGADTEANPAEVTVVPGDSLGGAMPNKPVRASYDFVNWNTKQNGQTPGVTIDSDEPITEAMAIEEDGKKVVNLYAQWTPNKDATKHTVTFTAPDADAEGGPVPTTIDVVDNTAIGAGNMPNDPVRTGWGFKGWLNEDNSTFDPEEPVTSDITLHADWVAQVDLTFDPRTDVGGAFAADSETEPLKVTPNVNLKAEDLAKYKVTAPAGYEFKEWNTAENGSGDTVDTNYAPAAAGTVYAIYQAADYSKEPPEAIDGAIKVKFDSNGAEQATKPTEIYVKVGNKISDVVGLPTAPERTGYRCKGWYADPVAETTPITGDTVPSEMVTGEQKEITAYAHWEVIDTTQLATVTLYRNVDKENGVATDKIGEVQVIKNETLKLSPDFSVSRENFDLLRWNDASGTKVADTTADLANYQVKDDVSLYAIWGITPYFHLVNDSKEYNGQVQGIDVEKITVGDADGPEISKESIEYEFVYSQDDSPVTPKNAGSYDFIVQTKTKDGVVDPNADQISGANTSLEVFEITKFQITAALAENAVQTVKENGEGQSLNFVVADENVPVADQISLASNYKVWNDDDDMGEGNPPGNGKIGDGELIDLPTGTVLPTTKGLYAVSIEIQTASETEGVLNNYEFKGFAAGIDNPQNDNGTTSIYAKFTITPAVELSGITVSHTPEGGSITPVQMYDNKDLADEHKATFDKDAATDPYYAQIEAGSTVTIDLTGTLPDGEYTVKLFKQDGSEIDLTGHVGSNDEKTSVTIGPITLPEPDGTSTNDGFDNKLEIKIGEKTYNVALRQLKEATIELAPGNSPYGLIERMGLKEEGAWTADDITAAKTAFNAGNRFTAEWTPDNGDAKVVYTPNAWFGANLTGVDLTDVSVNLDRDPEMQVIYNKTDFADAGFTAYDSLGKEVDKALVTRTISVKRMDTNNLAGLSNVSDDLDIPVIEDTTTGLITCLSTGKSISPGIYIMKYDFTDPVTGNPITTVERKIVVLWENGDVDMSMVRNNTDGNIAKNIVGNRTKPYETCASSVRYLHEYRICDMDQSSVVNNTDGNIIKNVVGGRGTDITYYFNFK